jgi:uncharacterized phiE125 gp8 family phage protein
MGTRIIVPPASYPVSIYEAKKHVNAFDFDDDDELLNLYIRAATLNAENFTGRAFIDQVVDFYVDGFPSGQNYIELSKPPLIEFGGVFYSESADAESEWDASSYLIDTASQKARVILGGSSSWPMTTTVPNSVRMRYRAGYVADAEASPLVAAVPDDIKAAILLSVGTLYAQRETIVIGQAVSALPWSAEQMLRPYRIHTAIG